jgi:hypothetical protein
MKKLLAITSFMLMCHASVGLAAPQTDELIEGAKLCTKHLPRYEREYGIPTHLLSAIASTESGRFHEGLKIRIPWPWTINAEGKGYFFDTKEQAIAAAKKLRAQGVRSMDVGCMQVNVLHHSGAFASLEEGFDPQKNIAYAASFLRSLYEENQSWKQAAASYHSRTPSRGTQYVSRVYDHWYTIIEKLRAAKMQVPSATTVASAEQAPKVVTSVKKFDVSSQSLKNMPVQQMAQAGALPEQRGKQMAAYQAPHMNSIQIGDQKSRVRENGIIVVRPDIKVVDEAKATTATAIKVAQISPSAGESKIIRLDNAVVKTTGTKKPGPNFIFDN